MGWQQLALEVRSGAWHGTDGEGGGKGQAWRPGTALGHGTVKGVTGVGPGGAKRRSARDGEGVAGVGLEALGGARAPDGDERCAWQTQSKSSPGREGVTRGGRGGPD